MSLAVGPQLDITAVDASAAEPRLAEIKAGDNEQFTSKFPRV